MPQVIDPCDGCQKNTGTFTWDMTIGGLVYYTSSIVVVGSQPLSETIYPGANSPAMKVLGQNQYTDRGVHHPGGNAVCYTRPKYSKSVGGGGPFWTVNSLTTSFISTAKV